MIATMVDTVVVIVASVVIALDTLVVIVIFVVINIAISSISSSEPSSVAYGLMTLEES